MRCEYHKCNKKAIVKIFHTYYCIKHAIEVLVSLYFLYDDKYYEKASKLLNIILTNKEPISVNALSKLSAVPYYSTQKILYQLKTIGIVEEVDGKWRIKQETKYLGLV